MQKHKDKFLNMLMRKNSFTDNLYVDKLPVQMKRVTVAFFCFHSVTRVSAIPFFFTLGVTCRAFPGLMGPSNRLF